ncbi:MAG: DUF4007 family protein, partial [Hymenobacter sp.]
MLLDRLIFQGHDTFLCRNNWLKKGYDFIQAGGNFNDADAVVQLGVGKNMVTSIRYWMKAFGLTDEADTLRPVAHVISTTSARQWTPVVQQSPQAMAGAMQSNQQWSYSNNTMMPPSNGMGNSPLFGITGISNDYHDLMGNDHNYSVMPPPGFSHAGMA